MRRRDAKQGAEAQHGGSEGKFLGLEKKPLHCSQDVLQVCHAFVRFGTVEPNMRIIVSTLANAEQGIDVASDRRREQSTMDKGLVELAQELFVAVERLPTEIEEDGMA